MPPVNTWRSYEDDVATIAGDLLAALVGGRFRPLVQRRIRLAGRNGPHQIDVLATAGRQALFIECKHHSTPLTKDSVTSTLYNFLDVCNANRIYSWSLAMVSSTDIPIKARLPAMRPEGIYSVPANVAGGSLATAVHFVYFRPPRAPERSAPFLLNAQGGSMLRAGPSKATTYDEAAVIVADQRLDLGSRVAAGLVLAAVDPGTLARDLDASRVLVHGLLHLGQVQEALYLQKAIIRQRGVAISDEIARLMMVFQLHRGRYGPRIGTNARTMRQLLRLAGEVPARDLLAIQTFAGPVLARQSPDEGIAMMNAAALTGRETDNAGYFELLRLVRMSQVVEDASWSRELTHQAAIIVPTLPAWHRFLAVSLMAAVASDGTRMHGIEAPFDATEWVADTSADRVG